MKRASLEAQIWLKNHNSEEQMDRTMQAVLHYMKNYKENGIYGFS